MLLTYYKMIEDIFFYLRWWRDEVSVKLLLFFHFWKEKWAIKDIYYILLRFELLLNSAPKHSKKIQFVLMAEALTVLTIALKLPSFSKSFSTSFSILGWYQSIVYFPYSFMHIDNTITEATLWRLNWSQISFWESEHIEF